MRKDSCVGRSFGVSSAQPAEVQSRKRHRAEAIITQLTVTIVGEGIEHNLLLLDVFHQKSLWSNWNFIVAVRYHHSERD